MAILINDTTPRAQYTATSGQTVFSVPFEFFENADLKVYKNSTLLTLTTHYTVTGAGVTGGGSITLVTGATAGDVLTITRDIAVKRVTDFPTSGPFNVDALNTDLDRLTAMMQERENGLTRVVQLSETDTAASLQLPETATRANKVLGFNGSGTAIVMQEIGNFKGNWAASTAYVLRDIIKDTSNSNIYICIVAHTSSGSQPISSNADSAKWALIVDASAAATSASNAATSETNAAASAILANDWATKTSSPVAGGEYSAKYHAQAAATSASNASTSATNAASSASTASTQATNASNSASSASTSATNAANSATAASASAAAAAAAAASGLYRQVLDKTANYTIVAADQGTLFRANTGSGSISFTLPAISTVSDGFKVSIVKWTSDANTVDINRAGSDTINGGTTTQITSQYAQVILVADFESNTWFASQSGLGATNMNIDLFSGNGSTTAFTLTADPSTENNVNIFISGVQQAHSTYSIAGTTLTFSTAPPSGSSNIEVIYGTPLAIGTPSDGTVSASKIAAGAVDLTTKVTGVLPAVNGGTGLSSPGTSGNVLTSNGTNWVSSAPNSIPTGTILSYGSSTPPSGYLACDGSTYTKSSYTALSTVLGNVMSNTFTRTYTSTTPRLAVVANSRIFLLIGDGTAGSVSSDSGVTWSSTGSGISHSVAWNGTRYVSSNMYYTGCLWAVGLWYSTTGTSWTGTTTNVNYAVIGPVWTGSRFIVTQFDATNAASSYSTDGVTWTAGGTLTNIRPVDIAYGNSIVVCVGTGTAKIATTTDGSTWTSRTAPAGLQTPRGVSYVNNQFVIVDSSGNLATSTDGITWTLTYTQSSTSALAPYFAYYPNVSGTYVPQRVAYNSADGRYYYGSCYSTNLTSWFAVPYSSVYGAYQPDGGYSLASYIGRMFNCASDGTRLYNPYGAVYNPYPYTTATQFIVPNLSSQTSGGTYYYIKT